jgi:hypothetical protein
MLKLIAIVVLCCLVAGPVLADRLILTPTGHILTGLKAEYAAAAGEDFKAYWAQVGISRIEIEGARFQDFGPDDADAVSAAIQVVPETTFTPSVAIGVRDISDDTEGKGGLYDGRSVYLAASVGIPVTGGAPLLFQDMKVHGGFGTGGSLSGFFFGVSGKLPMGIGLMGEYDTEDWNLAASYSVIPTLKLQASSIKGDIYYGALFSAAF